jgi:DNA-binding beta-propeller fold protein YncE/urocanate hydratase
VTPTNPSIAKGTTRQFIATGVYTDNTTQNLTSLVTWTSSDTSVGSIGDTEGSNGLAAGESPGSTTITAVVGNVSGATTLTVTAATLVSIGVTPTSSAVAKGLKSQFTATGIYSDSSTQNLTANVVWSSSNPTVLTVSNASGYDGLATALNPGPVTVTAALDSVSGSTSLAVTAATLVSIGVTPADSSLARGTTRQFVAIGTYTDNSTQNLTSSVAWTTSDTSVGSISNAAGSNGLVTAVGLGSVTIMAALGDVSGSTPLTVTPAALISIAVTPRHPGIANGTHQQFVATGTYTDNSTQLLTTSVTWTSSDTTVASISNASSFNGLATAVAQGAVTVTATVGGISAATRLLVTPATLVSIALTPASSTVADGDIQQFVATGTYTDNTTQDLTDSVAWMSSDGAIAAISNAAGSHGLATTVGVGTASVSAVLGGVTSPAAMLTVTAPLFVYVPDSLSNTVLQYSFGPNGALISTGSVAAGVSPMAVTADPAGRYVYVTNFVGTTVSEYAIGTGGILTPIGSVVTASLPVSLTVDPAGRFVYVLTVDSVLSEYTIGADGALTLSGTVATGTIPFSVAVDPTGHYIYVTNVSDNTLSEYAVDAVGALISLGTVPTGGMPMYVTVDPSGHYVYAVNQLDQTISQFTIATDGTLIAGIPVATGSAPSMAVVDPTDHYAYVVNQGDNDISEYTIGTDGALTFMDTVVTGSGPTALCVDPSGRYVYVTNSSDGTVSKYTIGPGGALAPSGTVPAGTRPSAITVAIGS